MVDEKKTNRLADDEKLAAIEFDANRQQRPGHRRRSSRRIDHSRHNPHLHQKVRNQIYFRLKHMNLIFEFCFQRNFSGNASHQSEMKNKVLRWLMTQSQHLINNGRFPPRRGKTFSWTYPS